MLNIWGRIRSLVLVPVVDVFQLNLSPTHYLSHSFLTKLVERKGLHFTISTHRQFVSNLAVANEHQPADEVIEPQGATGSIVLFAEGLNLEKLARACETLSESMTIGSMRLQSLPHNPNMIGAKASVSVENKDAVPALLEDLALSLQIELAYLESAPKLNEPGLILMDMDSTVIEVECIDEIAKLAGVGEQVSEVTELAMQGKLDFAQSLVSRVACLEGAEERVLQTVRDSLPLMAGIPGLIHLLKAHGWKVAIASGGFTYFADYLKDRLELDFVIANTLGIENNQLTGKVNGDIVDANVKAHTLLDLANRWGIPKRQTIALGDGANDLIMMAEAGLGVAYHAKPIVRQKADVGIRFSSTDSLLLLLD